MISYFKTFTPTQQQTSLPLNHPTLNRNTRYLLLTMIAFLIIGTVFFIAVTSEDYILNNRIDLHKTKIINSPNNLKYDTNSIQYTLYI